MAPLPPWLTEKGVDLSRYPIDSVLRQAVSPDDGEFRTGCTLLKSMSYVGRVEAGVFLLGLLSQYPDNYQRLTRIVEAIASFPTAAAVRVLASELRRVKGSSATRAYLRQVVDTLESYPTELTEETIEALSSDPDVGVRFRQHLRTILQRRLDV